MKYYVNITNTYQFLRYIRLVSSEFKFQLSKRWNEIVQKLFSSPEGDHELD